MKNWPSHTFHDVRLQHLVPNLIQARSCSLGRVVACVNDLLEGGLKGSTTDKESINVGQSNELVSILIGHATAVEDASLVGCLSRHIGS